MSAAKRHTPTPESIVVRNVLTYLGYHPRVAWAHRMNTGAVMVDARHVRFGFVGCSDILGQLKDGRLLAIECKSAKGSATGPQEAFLERVIRHGGVGGIARSIADASAILERAI